MHPHLSDHHPVSPPKRRRGPRWLGVALIAVGTLLVLAGSSYFLYAWIAEGRLGSLAYDSNSQFPTTHTPSLMTLEGLKDAAEGSPGSLPTAALLPDPATMRLYPGELLAFNYWADPASAQPPPPPSQELAEGFLTADRLAPGVKGTLSRTTFIRIQAIELDAEVKELQIIDLGDSRQYDTPKNVVGHIPESANPGEVGNVWLFGHLQSPIRGEGAVFRDLPSIPDILRTGQRVYVVLDTPAVTYLYEVYKTQVVPQEDFRLYETNEPIVTLVTCVPALTYDHRLIVTARLAGFKLAP